MNDFDKLKELLFGAEKEALDSISERVERPETRTLDVADVLAEAVHTSHKKNSELVEALTDPVGECLQQAFHDDPQTYSDALYPVLGPALRKSIAHTLKEFSQRINQAIEQSLTPKGLMWRLQASRAGIPFADFVMQRTLLYRVEQAYLISRENGLLIEHVHHSASKIKDSDAVSAMFTAIQDFAKESFSPDRTGRLESADMGEFTLWAVHGPHALLVCVIRGIPPKNLRGELSAILERIHFRFGDSIRDYSGDTTSTSGVNNELEKCLTFQAAEEKDDGQRGAPWPLIIAALLLVSLLSYFFYDRWAKANELDTLTTALREAPGMYVAEGKREGGQILIRGMRDPLAQSVAGIAENVGVTAGSIVAEMTPFQSLDAEIVRRRIDNAIGGLDSIRYELQGSTAIVTGDAPRNWADDARERLLRITGVNAIDFSGLVDSDLEQIMADIETASGTRFLFSSDTILAPGQGVAIRSYAQNLAALKARAAASNYVIHVTVVGSTDALGIAADNEQLAISRAEATAAILAESGVATDEIRQAGIVSAAGDQTSDMSRRFASVELRLTPAAKRL